jgi:hypothetical protein
MAEIEKICQEKKNQDGEMEYLVRWKGFSEAHDQWIKAADIQWLGSLLLYWRERNKRVSDSQKIREHKEEALPPPYVPNRKPVLADVVAIYPQKSDEDLFFVGQVLEISPTQLKVHWWSSKKLDGTYTPDFLAKKGKGHAGKFVGSIWKESIIDVLKGFVGSKRGKIEKQQLKQITKIANEYKKK